MGATDLYPWLQKTPHGEEGKQETENHAWPKRNTPEPWGDQDPDVTFPRHPRITLKRSLSTALPKPKKLRRSYSFTDLTDASYSSSVLNLKLDLKMAESRNHVTQLDSPFSPPGSAEGFGSGSESGYSTGSGKDSVGYDMKLLTPPSVPTVHKSTLFVSSSSPSYPVSITATVVQPYSELTAPNITTVSATDITVKSESMSISDIVLGDKNDNTKSAPGSQSDGAPDDGRKFTAHVLPPCRVCGAQATGFHYGVNTCEACKGFFHRSLTRHHTYVCLKNSKCEVKPGRRNSCSYCRYQRCLEVNMSKQSIKTGRYTYEKRTKDILELNKLKVDTKSKEMDAETVKKIESFISEVMRNKDKMVEGMLKSAHRKYNPNFSEEDLEKGRIKLRCLVPQTKEFEEQNDELVNKWVTAVEDSGGLKHIIMYIKATPGFKEVDMSDQIQIIKASFCELWLVGRHNAFNTTKHTFTSIHGIRFDLVQALGLEVAETIAIVIRRLQKLKLTEEETFLLMLFVVFSGDRADLAAPGPVADIQENIVEALLHLISKAHPTSSVRFARICACLVEMRTVSHLYHHLTKSLVSTSAEIPSLFWELISLS